MVMAMIVVVRMGFSAIPPKPDFPTQLATLDLLDLFPNTHHVETLSSFERAQ